MKITTIVGARPQFIKCAPVSHALRKVATEMLVHTGQHYDDNMSEVFFRDLAIPHPEYNLGVGSGSHGSQTGDMLKLLEEVLLRERPDCALVYGDTNSTLAGALAAAKLHIPVVHVEAGLRSFNRQMPEEINRVMTDHLSTWLFCPTETAVKNLAQEGITRGVHLVGDVMYDAILQFTEIAHQRSTILTDLHLKPKEYLLVTIHRPHNTDVEENLRNILAALYESEERVIFPVHPRTRRRLTEFTPDEPQSVRGNLQFVNPVGYLDMLMLEQQARLILTDSGGIQKEAYFFGVPCVTLRPETEWIETVETGWNVIVGSSRVQIMNMINSHQWPQGPPPPVFGDGKAAQRIVTKLTEWL
jgi:UDP-N-acetylglucosamine 2-epimerase